MINGNLDQFLDTGWYCEATLYLDGYIYWCEGFTDFNKNVTYHFMDKWRAVNEDNLYYHSILEKDGTIHRSRVYEDSDSDINQIKKRFLKAKLFNNKSFWEAESKLAWLDEANPIYEPND